MNASPTPSNDVLSGSDRVGLSRRHLVGGFLAAGVATVFGRSAFAQEGSPAATTGDGTEASWIKDNLNTIGEEQILSIPATGDRMVREFLEYRPYVSIGQFRQEIGKYVDPELVAGYGRYVFVPIDPNQADAATLAQLPGLAADEAEQLVAARPFADDQTFLTALAQYVSPEQAEAASGYLAATAQDAVDWVTFNLNTAAAEQFLTIPGVGDRMLREFQEYRPYGSIETFRQEIGKYVDAAQVAAYEGYVFVPVDPNQADAATLVQLPGVDDAIAQELIGARPFADAQAFLAALGEHVSEKQVTAAASFLVAP